MIRQNDLSPDFVQRIVSVHGPNGTSWLANLPNLLASIAHEWSLELGDLCSNLSYSLLVHAHDGHGNGVLKLAVPGSGFRREIEALELMQGDGCVRSFRSDVERGAVLLDLITPGTELWNLYPDSDDEATIAAARLLRRLERPMPATANLPTAESRRETLDRARHALATDQRVPVQSIDRALSIVAELLDSMGAPRLLHGDLHHGNILLSETDGWTAIDPHGLVGEVEMELGPFLCNPRLGRLGALELRALFERRIAIFAEALGLDRDRIARWTFVYGIVSAWWSIEDGEDSWPLALACAAAAESNIDSR